MFHIQGYFRLDKTLALKYGKRVICFRWIINGFQLSKNGDLDDLYTGNKSMGNEKRNKSY